MADQPVLPETDGSVEPAGSETPGSIEIPGFAEIPVSPDNLIVPEAEVSPKISISTDPPITCLFLDIGGVLLTNGWDRNSRKRAADAFALDYDEMDERHHLTFDTYEEGKLSLEEYLDRVVFYEPRSFTHEEFKDFMFAQSKPFPEMLALMRAIKLRYGLKIAVVSNEGRELTTYRIEKFGLGEFIDFFISSCFVHFRKPDEDMYRVALDIAQVEAKQVLYIEDRMLFIEVAEGLGIRGLKHVNYETTKKALAERGLEVEE